MLARLLVAVVLWLGAAAARSPLSGAAAGLAARSPLLAAKQRGNLDPARHGRRGNLTLGFQPFAAHGLLARDLFKRECVDAGYGTSACGASDCELTPARTMLQQRIPVLPGRRRVHGGRVLRRG